MHMILCNKTDRCYKLLNVLITLDIQLMCCECHAKTTTGVVQCTPGDFACVVYYNKNKLVCD